MVCGAYIPLMSNRKHTLNCNLLQFKWKFHLYFGHITMLTFLFVASFQSLMCVSAFFSLSLFSVDKYILHRFCFVRMHRSHACVRMHVSFCMSLAIVVISNSFFFVALLSVQC